MNKDVFNRRQFLKVTGATAAGTALFGLTTVPSWAHPTQALTSFPELGVSVSPFPLSQVSLLAGPFQDNMNRTLAYNATVTLIPFYKNHQNYTVYWNTH